MEQLPSPPHPAPTLYDAAAQVIAGFPPMQQRARADGWTPERQRAFCEVLADCGLVREAAMAVGMSPQSAYQLKRRAEGKGFSLAWDAALLLAKPRLVDLAIERAVDGNEDEYVKDGVVVGARRKKDVRHLLAAITKLEHAQMGDPVIGAVADDFDAFLDCMEAEAQGQAALSAPDDGSTGRKAKGKAVKSPLVSFFQERECGPGLEGYEFEGVLGQLSRSAGVKRSKAAAKRATKTDKTGKPDDCDDDAVWSDWDRDAFDPDGFRP